MAPAIMTLNPDNIPDPVRTDAPSPDEFDRGESVDVPLRPDSLIAVDFDGERYCMECANPEYVELCNDDPRKIPYGGPVPRGSEVDCPGSSCGNCLRMIEGFTILHYDGVCGEYCPEQS